MVVLGIEKVEKALGKTDTDIDGQGWVANAVMGPQNGKKRYKLYCTWDLNITFV